MSQGKDEFCIAGKLLDDMTQRGAVGDAYQRLIDESGEAAKPGASSCSGNTDPVTHYFTPVRSRQPSVQHRPFLAC